MNVTLPALAGVAAVMVRLLSGLVLPTAALKMVSPLVITVSDLAVALSESTVLLNVTAPLTASSVVFAPKITAPS